jgi:hypothetical protein
MQKETMKEILTILIFSSSLLRTPKPIDIGNEWVELIPKKPITAITGGGTLYLDVTNMIGKLHDARALDTKFPIGAIEAELIPENGPTMKLNNGSAYSYNQDNVRVIMLPTTEMPINVKFKKIKLRSGTALRAITVTWSNCKL